VNRAGVCPRLTHDLAKRSAFETPERELGFGSVEQGVDPGLSHLRGYV
jgi:hypothetical protein